MKEVLISIKPKWCELIASGKKTIEIRKTRPKIKTPFKCYIYCTKEKYKGKYLHTSNKEGRLLGWENPNDCEITVQPENFTYIAHTCRGKVIGEFVCDDVSKFTSEFTDDNCYEDIRYHYFDVEQEEQEMIVVSNEWENYNDCWTFRRSCVSFDDLKKYIGINFHDIPFYFWNISELKIYDEPKDLSEFRKPCIHPEMPYCPDCKNGYEYISESEAELYRIDGECKAEWWCLNNIKRPPQSWCYVEKTEE